MADVLAVRDDYRAQTWRMLIQECSNSGLTKREFCRRRGISEKSFYYWLRKLRSQMAEAAGCHVFNGMYMLLHQGVKAFHIWTGLDMPVEIVREKYFK